MSIKPKQDRDAMLRGPAKTLFEGIKAEPVPEVILELATVLQAKFAERAALDTDLPVDPTRAGN